MKLGLGTVVVTLLVCAQPPAEAAQAGQQQYIVKLKYLFVQPNASAPAPIKDVVTNVGGHVDFEWFDRLVISIPDAAVNAISRHPLAKYIQKVITGAPTPESSALQTRPIVANAIRTPLANSSPPWDSGAYAYDGAGNIKTIGTDSYTYDTLSRLVESHTKGTRESYAYDTFGNLTYKTTYDATPPHEIDLTTDDGGHNQLKYFGSYDTAGNLTGDTSETNNYDPFNMQREKNVSGGAHEYYFYNASDERIGVITDPCPGQSPPECSGSLVILSFRDEEGKVLRQFDIPYSQFGITNYGPMLWLEDYVYRDGLLLGGERPAAEGGRRHFHLDHLGTPRLVTGPSGQHISEHDYYPFGVEITPLGQEVPAGFDREEPMKFTGHLRDFNVGTNSDNANYNDYMHARSTAPQWGRFLTVDSAKVRLALPSKSSRYSYAGNNPLRYFDPNGRAEVDFRIRHFIAEASPQLLFGRFQGDNRVFSLRADHAGFRTEQHIRIETDPGINRSGRVLYEAQTERSLNRTFGILGKATGESMQASVTRLPDNNMLVVASQNEPLPPLTAFGLTGLGPGIRSVVNIIASPDAKDISIFGTRSSYPSFEINVTVDDETFSAVRGSESPLPLGFGILGTDTFSVTCHVGGAGTWQCRP